MGITILSWNVNGIRAVERKKDLQAFLAKEQLDILCIQEIKGTTDKFSKYLTENEEYTQFYHSAQKPGYAGTGIWVKKTFPYEVSYEKGMKYYNDTEGRVSKLSFSNGKKEFDIFGVYFPNGGKSKEAWEDKLVFYESFLKNINELRAEGREVLWCGDVNCAHNEIDLARPEENKKSIGFLPEEREWVSKCVENGWTDIYRKRNPDGVVYSWWHLLTKARGRNIGWRIDYFFCNEEYEKNVEKIEYLNDQMGSDHCPVKIQIAG